MFRAISEYSKFSRSVATLPAHLTGAILTPCAADQDQSIIHLTTRSVKTAYLSVTCGMQPICSCVMGAADLWRHSTNRQSRAPLPIRYRMFSTCWKADNSQLSLQYGTKSTSTNWPRPSGMPSLSRSAIRPYSI